MNCPHCGTDLMEHEANRCLDAWIATKITHANGKRKMVGETTEYNGFGVVNRPVLGELEYPPYSSDIACAWAVVEKMKSRMLNLRLTEYAYNRTYATFKPGTSMFGWNEANGENATSLAICRAALLATEASDEAQP